MTYEDWLESRRYRIKRCEGREIESVVHTGLTFGAARGVAAELQAAEDLAKPNIGSWTKTLFLIELETERWNPGMGEL